MSISKMGAKLSGSIIVAAVLSFFLYISMIVIFTPIFTKDIGYNAYVYTKEGDEPVAEYKYYYNDTDGDGKDDGADTKKAEYEEQGYVVTTYKTRSVLEGTPKTVCLVLTQVLSMILLISFASSSVYKQGFKDANLVRTGNLKPDILKGLKIGAVAYIPFFLIFVLTLAAALGAAPKFSTVWYMFLNSHYYSLIYLIVNGADVVSKLGVWQFVLIFLLQLIVPLISEIAYILGFKEINFTDKFIYKKRG